MAELTTSVVRLEPQDWRRFRSVRQRALRSDPDAFAASAHRWLADLDVEARWRERLAVVCTYVAARDGSDVGTAGIGDGGEVVGMWVAPDARGTGVARALVDAVLADLPVGSSARLRVMAENVRAVAFYERCGFALDGPEPDAEGCLTMVRTRT